MALKLLLLLGLFCAGQGRNLGRLRTDDDDDEGEQCDRYTAQLITPDKPTDEDVDGGASGASLTTTGRNCSQLAANIAAKAAQVATAANEAQASAAEYAAKEVRLQLAGKALQASRAAQAVLEGKRALLDKTQRELSDLDEWINKLGASLELSEANAKNAEFAAKSAESHFGRLNDVVQLVASSLADVDALADIGQSDLKEKQQMLVAAKERSDRIQKDISCARDEYQQVKVAAYQAACAAVDAKKKAAATATATGGGDKGKCNTSMRRRHMRFYPLKQIQH
ncbi:uncharacterized protein LOC6569812 [Drosophila grimshawi]|uniref:uncharacterized protein LOC6569812 n=1 Tax=Drosophila grimshawi TaxID=7222 RepID=UPI000C86EAA7|nr:uncharacterized protein LOC6569812 [Drosophila grimshawi]